MKLTAGTIDTLTCRGKTETTYFDDSLPGFGLRCRASGVRRWIVQYEGPSGGTKRITIGSPEVFGLEEAKRIARTHLAKRALGHDPAAEKAEAKLAAKLTLGSVVDRYLADRRDKLRPLSVAALERDLLRWWKPLHGRPLNAISRKDIAAHLTGPPVAAARARANLMALFAWAMKQGEYEGPNPVIGAVIPDAHVKPRERVLSEAELVQVWQASGDDAYGAIVKLLILTGCRRQEVGSMRWDELDQQRGVWIIPGERTKNGRAHTLPLPAKAWEIIATVPRWHDGAFVFGRRTGFQSWALGKRALDQRAGLAPWVLHDIRRSVATGMAEIGILPHVIEAVLNHASGHKRGIAGIYNKASYEREMRAALALWADHVRSLVEGGERKIIPLR